MNIKDSLGPAAPTLILAWREAVLATFAAADAHLADPAASDSVVHAARRELKRLAALSRLAPADMRELARRTRAAADRARRALGGSRDAAVLTKLIESAHLELGAAEPAVRAAVEKRARPLRSEAVAAGRDELAALRENWKGVEPARDDDLLARVVGNYRRARRRMDKAREGSASALHRWRSAVVAHHCQMTFLVRLAPALRPRAKALDALRDRLGDWNDIDMLQVHTRDGLAKAERRALGEAVADDKERLVKAAEKAGNELFAARPRAFRAELADVLEAALSAKSAPGTPAPKKPASRDEKPRKPPAGSA
jgi:hypothetical protein